MLRVRNSACLVGEFGFVHCQQVFSWVSWALGLQRPKRFQFKTYVVPLCNTEKWSIHHSCPLVMLISTDNIFFAEHLPSLKAPQSPHTLLHFTRILGHFFLHVIFISSGNFSLYGTIFEMRDPVLTGSILVFDSSDKGPVISSFVWLIKNSWAYI